MYSDKIFLFSQIMNCRYFVKVILYLIFGVNFRYNLEYKYVSMVVIFILKMKEVRFCELQSFRNVILKDIIC